MSSIMDLPPAVDCDGEVLNSIRVAVVDGLHKIPHGGVEIGGLLLGKRQTGRIRITEWQAISCEHASGPSFTLSEADEAGLRESIEAAAANGLDVVGWFHSHTRSDLCFTEKDQALHERFFPDPLQVALLLRPAMLQATRAAFFRRRSGGSWDLNAEEFLLDLPEKALRRGDDSGNDYLIGTRTDEQSSVPGVYRSAPVLAAPAARKWEKLRRATAAAVAIVALAGLLLVAWRVAAGRSSAPIALSLQDNGGRIQISWNSRSPALQDAREGRLIIQDGAHSVEHRLSTGDLQRGSMEYLRSADNVQVRLTVLRDGEQPTEAWTSFIGPLPSRDSESNSGTPARERTEVTAEAKEVTAEAKTEADEAARIQAMQADEARLRAEMQRLEQARIKAEQERAAYARVQAERERGLRRMAEEAKKELARLQQLKATPAVIPPSAGPDLSPAEPARAPVALQNPQQGLDRLSAPPASRQPEPARYSGPASGRLIWTGDLPRNGIISIEEARASLGAVTGQLPRQPVRLKAYPAELSERGITIFTSDPSHSRGVEEPPSRQNGWNQTTYKWAPGRATDLSVVEAPAAGNDWRKIVLRNDGRRLSMIVLDWEFLHSARR